MLEGDLSDFTLPDILRLLAFTSKTGRLRLSGPRGQGRVDLLDGRIRDASADAQHLPLARRLLGLSLIDASMLDELLAKRERLPTDLELAQALVAGTDADAESVATVLHEQMVDAVFDLLRWDEAAFRFHVGDAREPGAPELGLAVEELLSEAEQRLEVWPTMEKTTGPGDAVVSISRPQTDDLDIPRDGWSLLAFVDGRRTVDDLVVLAGRGQFDTRRTLGTLVDLGVVAVGESGGDGQVEQLVAAHEALEKLETKLGPADPVDDVSKPAAQATGPGAGKKELLKAAVQQVSEEAPAADGEPSDAEAPQAPAASASEDAAASDGEVTPLKTKVRSERLKTDPSVNADLVSRLIDGVEGL